jgi:hypothetical protein
VPKTFFNATDRERIIDRISRLAADTPRHWGRMTAPQMVAHLRDQMAHCLGDRPATPVKSILRWPPIRFASIYLIPWPKGRIKGPIDAFVTQPGDWDDDVNHLIALVRRFAARDPGAAWPPHALLGRMTGRDWGAFCHKHFDHHLRQFGR